MTRIEATAIRRSKCFVLFFQRNVVKRVSLRFSCDSCACDRN